MPRDCADHIDTIKACEGKDLSQRMPVYGSAFWMIRQYGETALQRARWYTEQAEKSGRRDSVQRWHAVAKAIGEIQRIEVNFRATRKTN